ncbi:MAG: S-methyl-5'-thioadenosine phosphorylase [Ilumatobacteraceae bacterium]
MNDALATVGVFGGSGFYELLAESTAVEIDTPYGPPSSPVMIGALGGHRVAFIARHGTDHRFAAHRVPYRANVWAMRHVGVRAVVAPCSVGSLRPGIHPGQMVVVDQLVDRTWGRPDTFHDRGAPGGAEVALHHQAFADPYHAGVRDVLVRAARECAVDVVDGGVMVVINGPRFSTRAESIWFRQMGWHVVNMTGYPEAVLAAEAGLRYASIALVTDRDASDGGGVTMDEVFEMIRANVTRVTAVIGRAVTDHHDELVGTDERDD